MANAASNVDEYLAALPDDRRAALMTLRKVVQSNLPVGYEEAFNWGMITYEVPLAIEPKTNNGKPLMYAALASQKNHMAVYLCSFSCVEGSEAAFTKAWKALGLKLDLGKSCLRFKRIEDLDLPLIGSVIAATSVAAYVKAFKARYMTSKS